MAPTLERRALAPAAIDEPDPDPGAFDPPIRSPVAVIVSRFPKITETFILREIQELERQGQPVRLVPLLRQRDPVVHPDAEPWVERALYTPFLSASILRENVGAFLESPARYLRVLGLALLGSLRSPKLVRDTLGIFPKSVYAGRVLEREGVGHLHGHFATHPATAAWIASEMSGIPWSFTAHAHDIFLSGSRPMLGRKLRKASFVRVISDYNRRFLEERYPHAADGRIRVIHMGIDPAAYGTGRPEPGRIVCVASLRPYKGILSLVEACAREPLAARDFRLEIVGDGPQRKAVEERIRRVGVGGRVRLLGPRTQDEVAELLASAAVFVHPSTVTRRGWMDGIPVALMEAMATGLPVVSTWVSGIPELVEDGREGTLVFPDDPGALSEALAGLLDDPERGRTMGELGRRKIHEAFHLERCAASLAATVAAHSRSMSRNVARAIEPGLGVAAGGIPRNGAVGLRRMRVARDSLVAELLGRTGEDGEELVVKVHRDVPGAPRTAAQRARTEFEVLRGLDAASIGPAADGGRGDGAAANGSSPGAVPRPLALLAPEGTLVMTRVPGRTLDTRLREWRGAAGEGGSPLFGASRATGRWLRWFQQQTPMRANGGSPREALQGLLQGAFRDLDGSRRWMSARLASAVRTRLRSLEEAILPDPPPLVPHHGDFWPGNVFVDGPRVSVIDFEGCRAGLPYEDVTYFLTHVDLALSRPRHRDIARRARREFLKGYDAGRDLDSSAMELCSIAKALHLLSRTSGSTILPTPARWWRRKVLRRILERIAREKGAGRT